MEFWSFEATLFVNLGNLPANQCYLNLFACTYPNLYVYKQRYLSTNPDISWWLPLFDYLGSSSPSRNLMDNSWILGIYFSNFFLSIFLGCLRSCCPMVATAIQDLRKVKVAEVRKVSSSKLAGNINFSSFSNLSDSFTNPVTTKMNVILTVNRNK